MVVNIIAFVIGIIIFFISKDSSNERKNERKQHVRYSIGITTDVHHNPRSSSKIIDFQYSFKDTTYTSYGTIGWLDNTVNTKGGKYYVEFSYINPKNCKMLFDRPVPMDIISSPDTGWVTIP